MKKFSELNIKIDHKHNGFIGKKIEIGEVFGKPIIIHAFNLVPSHYPKPGRERCLHLQIEIDGAMRVMFLSSPAMIRVLEAIPPEDFPFETVIRKNDKRFDIT